MIVPVKDPILVDVWMDSADLVKIFNYELGYIVEKTASIIDSLGLFQCSKRSLVLNVGEMCVVLLLGVARVKASKGGHFWQAIATTDSRDCEDTLKLTHLTLTLTHSALHCTLDLHDLHLDHSSDEVTT
eukprot:3391817-Rhodomonas_salina.1